MRRILPALTIAAALLVSVAPSSATNGDGGAEAVQAGLSPSGGVRYATLAPKPTGKPVKDKPSKRQKRRARRKARTKKPVPKPPVPQPAPPPASDHVFPIRGSFTFGGEDSRFGAGRPGHKHQGQDMSAAEGTPVVAPWPGTVEVVKFQAAGAGYYVVLDGEGEDRDYVFMHLRKGSILVERGQAVGKGQPIGEVGSTGASSGPHLHFEIWVEGGWYSGGHPVDPLPSLQSWL